MSRLSLYLPRDVERRLRQRARRAQKSLSAYVRGLVTRELEGEDWPADFASLFGSCKELKAPATLKLETRGTP